MLPLSTWQLGTVPPLSLSFAQQTALPKQSSGPSQNIAISFGQKFAPAAGVQVKAGPPSRAEPRQQSGDGPVHGCAPHSTLIVPASIAPPVPPVAPPVPPVATPPVPPVVAPAVPPVTT